MLHISIFPIVYEKESVSFIFSILLHFIPAKVVSLPKFYWNSIKTLTTGQFQQKS